VDIANIRFVAEGDADVHETEHGAKSARRTSSSRPIETTTACW
jgi:hypothetical protein